MIKFRFKKADRTKIVRADSTYSKQFSLAVLNWETNRQETRFASNIWASLKTLPFMASTVTGAD